jgi:small-conductance mechanosensitive channel
MKLRFRVPFGADIEQIPKMFKRIGQELLEHPEIKDDFIQPFKLQGVLEVDDYGLIIRAKFMPKPVRQFTIRHHNYRAVQEAFAAADIEFATPQARVVFDDDQEDATGNKNLQAR